MVPNFIVVDDDPVNNLICERTIKLLLPEADVMTFLHPEVALAHIKTAYAKPDSVHAVVFLDINMPALNGWEFLDTFEKFDPSVREKVRIHLLTSSTDKRDREQAANSKIVLDYWEKPLVREIVEEVLIKL